MGAQASSAGAEAFQALYTSLPDEATDQIKALCAKGDDRLLKPNPHSPPPYPAVPIGITVRLNESVAGAALATVPRLQRKHYELIPKAMTETDFWISFFSHITVILQTTCPEQLAAFRGAAEWKGNDASEGPNSFDVAWGGLDEAQRAAVAALAARDSQVSILLAPNVSASPPAFPVLPVGMECFIDEGAATAALTQVPGLQSKHYMLVPKKLDECAFWTNFLTHMTAIVRPTAGSSV